MSASPTTLSESLQAYADSVPIERRADALHTLFYGFYARVAIVDRTTHELARWARDELSDIPDLPGALLEPLRDDALYVGRELFGSRMQAMEAMRLVSKKLNRVCSKDDHPRFTLDRAIAFDERSGTLRSYALDRPGEHPDLPYDAFSYDPTVEGA